MTKINQKFVGEAIGAIDALRVFTHNVRLEDAGFGTEIHDGKEIREVIKFRCAQCWGRVERTSAGVSIKVIPTPSKAPAFVPRVLTFPRRNWSKSAIIDQPTDVALANKGRDFCLMISDLFERHMPSKFQWFYVLNGQEYLIMITQRTKQQLMHSDDVDAVATGMNSVLSQNPETSRAGLTVHIQHPAFDMRGGINVIDRKERIRPTNLGPFAERFKTADEGAQRLEPALMFGKIEGSDPMTFEITPHRFTLAHPVDHPKAQTNALIAAERLKALAIFNDNDDEDDWVPF